MRELSTAWKSLIVFGILLVFIGSPSSSLKSPPPTCSPKPFLESLANQKRVLGLSSSGWIKHDTSAKSTGEPPPSVPEATPRTTSSYAETNSEPTPPPPLKSPPSPTPVPTQPAVTPSIPHGTSATPAKQPEEPVVNNTVPEETAEPDPPEPIEPFEEWTKRKLEEQSRRKKPAILVNQEGVGLVNGNTEARADGSGGGVVTGSGGSVESIPEIVVETQRNYASKECGAKILLTNAESQHSGAVLKEKERDEYLLNPCQTEGRKFFIIELCEIIQPTIFELANFELFSSSPKEFLVRGSERYPTTEWTLLGQWTAEDLRKIQSFQISNRIYAKYVKVELLSHYGSEHFCPVSMVRVAGISMVDEFEEGMTNNEEPIREDQGTPVQTETPVVVDTTPLPEKEPEKDSVEIGDGLNETEKSGIINTAKETVINIANGISKALVGESKAENKGTKNASHCDSYLDWYMKNYKPYLVNCYLCSQKAFERNTDDCSKFCHFFAPSALRILSHENWSNLNAGLDSDGKIVSELNHNKPSKVTGTMNTSQPPSTAPSSSNEERPAPSASDSTQTSSPRSQDTVSGDNMQQTPIKIVDAAPTSTPIPRYEAFFQLISDLKAEKLKRLKEGEAKRVNQHPPVVRSGPLPAAVISHLPGSSMNPKESVFVRLNNRIKALEQNISLSSQYLSELSRQYKRQMEDIQKQYERASRLANLTRREAEERWREQDSQLRLWKARARDLDSLALLLRQQQRFWTTQAWYYIAVGLLTQLFVVLLICACCIGVSQRRLDSQVRYAVARQLQYIQGNQNGSATNGHCMTSGDGIGNHAKATWGTQTEEEFLRTSEFELSRPPSSLISSAETEKNLHLADSVDCNAELDLQVRPKSAGDIAEDSIVLFRSSSPTMASLSGRTPQKESYQWMGVRRKKKNPSAKSRRLESGPKITKQQLSASTGSGKSQPSVPIPVQSTANTLHSNNLFSLLRSSPEKNSRQASEIGLPTHRA